MSLRRAIREQQNQGYLSDGTTRLGRDGEPVRHFMGTSAFAEYTVMPKIALAKVSPEDTTRPRRAALLWVLLVVLLVLPEERPTTERLVELLLGVVVLGEVLRPNEPVGAAALLAAIAVSQGRLWIRRGPRQSVILHPHSPRCGIATAALRSRAPYRYRLSG